MSFYFCPPSGSISLQKLETFAAARLDFLIKVLEAGDNYVKLQDLVNDVNIVARSSCLIEGTKADKISHFFLRVACSKDHRVAQSFHEAEKTLFDFRFSCMRQQEVHRLMRSIRKASQHLTMKPPDLLTCEGVLYTLSQLGEVGPSWSVAVDKYFQGCQSGFFEVPFQFVLGLVAKRKVILQQGQALVTFNKLRDLVTSLFSYLLKLQVEKAKTIWSLAVEDERICSLFRKVEKTFLRCTNSECKQRKAGQRMNPSSETIDQEAIYFPPCMAHLHRMLRKKHRLRHHSRVQYTLFLKEVGLPVHEALIFWRREYSQQCAEAAGCSHDWHHNEKRYVYNIRHLYGLEGSCHNYRAHCCASIQDKALISTEEGGCPFVHFDDEHLRQLLGDEGFEGQYNKLVSLAKSGAVSEACSCYLAAKVNRLIKDKRKECQGVLNSRTLKLSPHLEVSAVTSSPSSDDVAEGSRSGLPGRTGMHLGGNSPETVCKLVPQTSLLNSGLDIKGNSACFMEPCTLSCSNDKGSVCIDVLDTEQDSEKCKQTREVVRGANNGTNNAQKPFLHCRYSRRTCGPSDHTETVSSPHSTGKIDESMVTTSASGIPLPVLLSDTKAECLGRETCHQNSGVHLDNLDQTSADSSCCHHCTCSSSQVDATNAESKSSVSPADVPLFKPIQFYDKLKLISQ